jgi:four helix bundle protein
MAFKFESLQVWQKAIELIDLVNHVSKKFPADELFVLSSQIRRAADSVALNIAEGSTGQSNSEFGRFLGIAVRSNIEVVACIIIARRRCIINENEFNQIDHLCEVLLLMISSLRNRLRKQRLVQDNSRQKTIR